PDRDQRRHETGLSTSPDRGAQLATRWGSRATRGGLSPRDPMEVTMIGWIMNKLRPIEARSSGSGYTAQVMAARDSFISGRRGVAELTATVQSCVSLWEGGFAMADVS